jgi:hypothetical protein
MYVRYVELPAISEMFVARDGVDDDVACVVGFWRGVGAAVDGSCENDAIAVVVVAGEVEEGMVG